MATAATIGKFKVSIDASNLEEVLSVSGVGKVNDTIEVTNFDSPAGTKEYIPGLAEGSEVSIECNYIHDATVQAALIAAVNAGSSVAVILTYNTTDATFTFNAAAQGFEVVPGVNEQNRINFTLKISGDITIA